MAPPDAMPEDPERDALLDETPEAVAMRRARAARAEAAAREPAPPKKPSRRRLLLGVVMGGVALVGVFGRLGSGR